ncbi:hypothetical protein WP50_03210, partial [Lactiplantibacillus plantarum]
MYGLEHPTTNERVFNAVAEESITTAAIARTISRKLNVPLKAKYNPLSFGDTAMLYLINCPTSSQLTRQILGWVPVQPDLLTDNYQFVMNWLAGSLWGTDWSYIGWALPWL